MKNPYITLLETLYSNFSRGDIAAVLAACGDSMTFQVPGKSKLAGKYTKANFEKDFVGQLFELSGGTLQVVVHDILASDRHAVALVSDVLTRNGQKIEYRTAHVWRFEDGKPVAWYEYPRDLYQYDAIWTH